ncbi:hypothetical protein F4859DRAFT_78378 [Xylaria cf. heliscus]|nr:hypothetical protein F4859DRAFT_78378 [Xylaria cf. heliscus]
MHALVRVITFFSALRGATALYDLPEPPLPRDVEHFDDLFGNIRSDVLKRSTHDATFPLAFGVTNQELFNGNFGSGTLTLTCVECKTTGEVIASAMLPDITDIDIAHPGDAFNTSMLGLTFNGVGATIDLDLTAAVSGDFSIPLLKTESPVGISGPGFLIGAVFSVDLVLQISGKIETEGGFQIAIPDGSSFMIPFDDAIPNVANFDGASASLLPLKVDAPADVTVALRLNVQAGLMLPDLEVIDIKALAGAFIALPEIILKESASFSTSPSANATCILPVSAELNINAGVFVDIGAEIIGIDLGEFNPTASTTLFAASTSTCLISASATAGGSASVSANATSQATRYSASAVPTSQHTSFSAPAASGWPAYPSAVPMPTTLATSLRPSMLEIPSQSAGEPSSLAVAALTFAAQSTAYPITLQSLATPITHHAAATVVAAAASAAKPTVSVVEAVSVVVVQPALS